MHFEAFGHADLAAGQMMRLETLFRLYSQTRLGRETLDGDFKHGGLLGADSPPEHFSVSVTDPRCEPWISLVLDVLSGNPSLWSAF